MPVTKPLVFLSVALAALLFVGVPCSAAPSAHLDLVFSPDQSSVQLQGYTRGAGAPQALDLGSVVGDGILSPDGKHIAYLDASGDAIRLVRSAPDGTSRKTLASLPAITGPSWSPDGRTLVFVTVDSCVHKAGLATVQADGTGLQEVRLAAIQDQVPGTMLHKPHLSRDGRSILVTAVLSRHGRPVPTLLVVDRASGSYRRLVDGLDGAWSPDGKHLVFMEVPALGLPGLSIAAADGSAPRSLGVPHSFAPTWSPDGSRLYFNAFADGHLTVWSARADGTQAAPVKAIPAGSVVSLSSKSLMLQVMGLHLDPKPRP